MRPPPEAVLRAFGVSAPPRHLVRDAWLAGDLVLKRDAGPVPEWLASALADVVTDGFRLAAPIAVRDGWLATRRLPGEPDPSDWAGVLAAGRAFHRAVAHLPRPSCLDLRDDPWARADRVAWGEMALRFQPSFADLAARLRRALSPMGPSQLVHGDLARRPRRGRTLCGRGHGAGLALSAAAQPPPLADPGRFAGSSPPFPTWRAVLCASAARRSPVTGRRRVRLFDLLDELLEVGHLVAEVHAVLPAYPIWYWGCCGPIRRARAAGGDAAS